MMAPIENFRLMLIFRISLFFVAFLGFCPSLFHLWDSDAQMYSAIAGFVVVIVMYLTLRPAYYCFEINRGHLWVATDREAANEVHLSIPLHEIIDYKWQGRKVVFYRMLENGAVAISKPTDVGLSSPSQKRALRSLFESLKKDHPYVI